MKFYQSALRPLGSLLILMVSTVHAADFQINNFRDLPDIKPGDGICMNRLGLCSLRAAIMEANALPNETVNGTEVPDTITLPDGTYFLTQAGSNEDQAATGDLDITDSLVINGDSSDPSLVTINAGGNTGMRDRVFQILSNNKVITVDINDLTITGGFLRDSRGGGGGICIKCEASDSAPYQPTDLGTMHVVVDTTFTPTTTTNNTDTSRPIVNLSHVVIDNNFDLVSGSGIMNSGILTITDSTISNNYSTFRMGMADGQNGQYTNNSQFIGGGVGGGIANWGGKLTIERSILSGNSSQSGGAIYNQPLMAQFRDEKILIEDSQITGNTAFMGGGIFNASGRWLFPSRTLIDYGFVANRTSVDHNRAEYAGGGIYNLGTAAMQLNNVTVSNNTAQDAGLPHLHNKGGGIYHSGKILDLVNSTVAQNIEPDASTGPQDIADNAAGGVDIFIDATEANVDPATSLPWRISFLNSIIGDSSTSGSCMGTTGFTNFVTDSGGNVDNSGTCFSATTTTNTVTNTMAMQKVTMRSNNTIQLGELSNNGGISGKELPNGTFPPTLALVSNNSGVQASNCPETDQRGFGRDESSCSPGAFQDDGQTKGVASSSSDLPIARDDRVETVKDATIAIPVSELLKNDNDPLLRGAVSFDINSLTALDSNAPNLVVTTGRQTNTGQVYFVTFTLPTGFVGQTQFTYTVSVKDDKGQAISASSKPATVTVDVKDTQTPIAYTQSFSVAPGATYTGNLSQGLNGNTVNAYDMAGEQLTYTLKDQASHGQATISANGDLSFTADANASGTDSFSYTVTNTSGLTSKPATISVTYKMGNVTQLSAVSSNAVPGKLVLVDLSSGISGNFYFALNNADKLKQGKVLWLDERSGHLLYQANANASGSEQIDFTALDLNASALANETSGFQSAATITIGTDNTTNQAPTANAFSESLDLNNRDSLSDYISTKSAASDADSDTLVYTLVSKPSAGEINNFDPIDGYFTYKNTDHSASTDSFQFTVSDGPSTSAPVTVTINITPQTNVAPVAKDDSAMTASDTPIGVNVTQNDTDANGDKLKVSLDSDLSTNGGKVSVNKQNILLYTPPSNFTGQDSVSYKVSDGLGGNATAMLKINVIQASPGGSDNTTSTDQSTNTTSTATADTSSSSGKSTGHGSLSLWVLLTFSLRWILPFFGFLRKRRHYEK